jgi:hypothetical protein
MQVNIEAGVDPTIMSYNARAVKIHNATSSLVRFEDKNVFLYFEKMFYLTNCNAGSVMVDRAYFLWAQLGFYTLSSGFVGLKSEGTK